MHPVIIKFLDKVLDLLPTIIIRGVIVIVLFSI